MDRPIVYYQQIPLETDLLSASRYAMEGLGFGLQAVLGTSTLVDGLACTPSTPAALTVQVAPGAIYSLQPLDGTAYSSLAADTTHEIVKQGLSRDTVTLSCPAPATTGQSIVYLVQAAYQDQDASPLLLPYYNAAQPTQAFAGPNNSGATQNTRRLGVCTIAVKAGVAATTGTQTTPAADAGYVGLFAVTVANGQTTITSANIAQLATAPFIGVKLGGVPAAIQAQAGNYAADTGAANAYVVTLSPALAAHVVGMPIRVKFANANTGASTFNPGPGAVAITRYDGSALLAGDIAGGMIATLVYTGGSYILQSSYPAVQGGVTAVGSITLDASYVGKLISNNAATGVTTTFPPASTIPAGKRLRFLQEYSSGSWTLQRNGTDSLMGPDGWNATSVALSELGAYVEFESDGSARWNQVGKVAPFAPASLVATGTDWASIVTPGGLASVMLGSSGQSFTNVTSSRAYSTVYTNSTGRPIYVYVYTTSASSSGSYIAGLVNGQYATLIPITTGAGIQVAISIFVPAGATYEVIGSGLNNPISWYEVR